LFQQILIGKKTESNEENGEQHPIVFLNMKDFRSSSFQLLSWCSSIFLEHYQDSRNNCPQATFDSDPIKNHDFNVDKLVLFPNHLGRKENASFIPIFHPSYDKHYLMNIYDTFLNDFIGFISSKLSFIIVIPFLIPSWWRRCRDQYHFLSLSFCPSI
jgi:hypothetical protein